MKASLDRRKRQDSHGAVALIMTLILMTLSTIIILFAANFGTLHSKSISNLRDANHAFEASQAGMQFGINYLRKNSDTILSRRFNGYLLPYSDSNTQNVSLGNNSTYTITYSNPIQNNYDLILITSVGQSADSNATRTTTQLVEYGSLLLTQPDRPIISKGAVSLSGSSRVINISDNDTIISGSTVSLSGSSFTFNDDGLSSTSGNIKNDITQDDSGLSGLSDNDLFSSYFGLSESLIKSSAGYTYSHDGDNDYSADLDGKQGTSIWIDQTSGNAIISGDTLIGSFNNPVLLVIDGNTVFTDSVVLFGFLYVSGTSVNIGGSTVIIGGVSAPNALNLSGGAQVIYSRSVLDNLQDHDNSRYYARVPGSWKDF